MSATRTQFESKLRQKIADGTGKQLFTDQTLKATISRWKEISSGVTKKESQADYKIMSRYAVINLGSESILVKRGTEIELDQVEKYISLESMYDILMEAHTETGHGGRDRVLHRLKERRIINVTRDIVEEFLPLCRECQENKPFATKGVVVKPIVTAKFGHCFQAGNKVVMILLNIWVVLERSKDPENKVFSFLYVRE